MTVLAVLALLLILGVGAVLIVRTLRFTSRQVPVQPLAPVQIDQQGAIERLSRAVQFQTISTMERDNNHDGELAAMRAFITEKFPLVHEKLTVELVNQHSLLYTWRGTKPGNPGVLLMAHLDVVPIEPGTEGDWKYPPFSGAIAEGCVWGRGAWDDKTAVMGIFEAAELLLRAGHQPERDIYFAFGHDEEIHGMNGGSKIAELLRQRGIRFDFVIDEGLTVNTAGSFNLQSRTAMIGIAEKGYMSVELKATALGGHSSRPPSPTAIGLLARAIEDLQANPMQAEITLSVDEMYEFIGPESPFWQRLIMANRWLLGWILTKRLLAQYQTAPLVRTTSVPTVIAGGIKDNVVPQHATVVVNFRILTGQTANQVLEYAKRVVNEPRIEMTPMFGTGDPTVPKTIDANKFNLVASTIRQVFPDAVVAPSLLVGRTDSRFFEDLAGAVYRFIPIVVSPADASRLHGTNERVATDNYIEAIQFYHQLIINSSPVH